MAYWGQYPQKLETIGNHIRKRRLDLRLKQKEVSRIIGVTRAMIYTWDPTVRATCTANTSVLD